MADWSIAKRIAMITIGLMAGLVLMAATGLFGTWSIAARVTAIAKAAEDVGMAVDASEHGFEAEAAQNAYRVTPGEAEVARFDGHLDALKTDLLTLKGQLNGDAELDPVISATLTSKENYRAAFIVVTGWQETHDAAVAVLGQIGPNIRQSLNSVVTTMIFDGNQRAILALQDARQAYLLGRIDAERFLLNNSPEDFENAQDKFSTAIELAETSANVSQVEARKTAIASVVEMLRTYRASFAEAGFAIAERNQTRDSMAGEAAALQSGLDTVLETLATRQAQTRDRAALTQRIAMGALLALGILGLVAGTVFARRATASITGSIDASVDTMSELAGGNLDVDIPGQDDANELGDIARALVVFRDTARETRALEAQSKAAEDDRKRREAQEAERAKEAEKARQAQAEADRQTVITSLRDSLGGVVDAAASGDFSQRITTRFDEPQLDAMARSINSLVATVEAGVSETAQVMGGLATGDLTQRMTGAYDGTFADLKTSVNETIDTLAQLVRDIAGQCDGLTGEVQVMTVQSGDLSRRAEEQAASLEETSAVMEEMLASAKSSVEGTQGASDTAAKATSQVEKAGAVVGDAVAAMGDIRDASERIGEIVSVIEGIAFQTNLLALNASVEAARAGSAGKGFAVVATEVRALAQRSSEASHDIKGLIEETTAQVNRGVALVETTGATLDEIVGGVRDMADVMAALSTTAREQASGVEDATGAITRIDAITQKNAELADESRATAAQVDRQAGVIQGMLSAFHLTTRDPAPAPVTDISPDSGPDAMFDMGPDMGPDPEHHDTTDGSAIAAA